MTDTHGIRLVRRVIREHKRAVVLITAGFVVNVLIYVAAVRPLERRVDNIEQSTRAGVQARAEAQAEFARASGTLTGKDRATKDLGEFYSKVLAQDLSGARKLTYGPVQRLAAENRLEYQGSRYEPVEERGSTLTKLKVSVEVTGAYPNMRSFIRAIETAPQFVVIENISLAEGGGEGALRLALDLSTYYRSASR